MASTAEQAIDRAIAAGQVSRTLPLVRREGIRLVNADDQSQDDAFTGIERGLREFYKTEPSANEETLRLRSPRSRASTAATFSLRCK